MKCTDILTQEHRTILLALEVLDHMAARIEQNQPIDPKDVEALLQFLRTFADDNHQAKEESALFPELMKCSVSNSGPLHQMIFEHDQERSLVEGLEDSLHTKKGMDFVVLAHRLTDLIRTHIRKEDNILFDIVERALSSDQDESVTTELQRFQIDPMLLADLRRLELIYLRRVA